MDAAIELVMAVRNCDQKEATAWLKENFGGKKSGGSLKLLEAEIPKVKISQDYIGGIAYYTIALFAEKDGKTVEHPFVITSAGELFPCTEDELQKRKLFVEKLPSPRIRWSQSSVMEYVSGAPVPSLKDCYDSILIKIREYLDLGNEELPCCLALWILGTYCYRLFSSYPYIHLNGNSDCGKTKTLTLIAQLSFNAKQISSGTSPASILRSLDSNCCTCCIDEAEGISKAKDDESRAVLTLLNTGYKMGGGDEKCEQDARTKQWRTVFFDGYSPKVLAGIRSLDVTLVTRCIPFIMVRSQNKEIKNREISEKDEDWALIRSMIYPAMLQAIPGIATAAQHIRHPELSGREWELWKPLLTLAMLIDTTGTLLKRMKALAIEIQKSKRDLDTSTPILLSALAEFFKEDKEEEKFYPTEDLYSRLAEYDEENYGWLTDIAKKNSRAKWIGHELRKSDVVKGRAELRSIAGQKCKGYVLNRKHIITLLSAYDGYAVTDEPSAASPSDKAE